MAFPSFFFHETSPVMQQNSHVEYYELPPFSCRLSVSVAGDLTGRGVALRRAVRHERTYWVYADVHIAGVVIHGVMASPAGVVWPTRLGEPAITFANTDLQARAEGVLMRLARREQRRHRCPEEGT